MQSELRDKYKAFAPLVLSFFALLKVGCGGGMDEGTAKCYDIGTATFVTLSYNPPTTNTDGSEITDLSGYRIYHRTASGAYSLSGDLDKHTTSYKATGLLPGTTTYFAVTAYNSANMESGFSNSVCVTTTH